MESWCNSVSAGFVSAKPYCVSPAVADSLRIARQHLQRLKILAVDATEAAVDMRQRARAGERGLDGVGNPHGFVKVSELLVVEGRGFGSPGAIHPPLSEGDAFDEARQQTTMW